MVESEIKLYFIYFIADVKLPQNNHQYQIKQSRTQFVQETVRDGKSTVMSVIETKTEYSKNTNNIVS